MNKTNGSLLAMAILAALCVVFWSATATSYPVYRDTTNAPSCYSCHNGFFERGPLHDGFHQGTSDMTNACRVCHTNTGDIPKTNSSGLDASHSCNGCHSGPGLRLHHAAAGAPADSDGLVCSDCHDSDPAPPYSEATLPAYYSRIDVNVKKTCTVASADGGEDWDGDGKGLDNDGDLAYEASDQDCTSTPVEPISWGAVKAIYR